METVEPRRLTRRELLGWAWVATLGALAAEGVGITLANLWPRTKSGGFGGKITAGSVADFPIGSIVHNKDGKCYISHLEEGFLALYHKCTHLGCTVPWIAEEDRFNCPCHQGIYNKKGEVLSGPPPRPLDLFPAEIVGGKVIVDTGRVIQREKFDPSQVVKG